MYTIAFDYSLPVASIAQAPVEPRDHSRLMLVDRAQKTRQHAQFFDIVEHLRAGDVLVWNNSKVFKARLRGKLFSIENQELFDHKKEIELFLVRPMENRGVWKALARPGRHVRNGMRVVIHSPPPLTPALSRGEREMYSRYFPDGWSGAESFFCDVMVKEKDGTLLVQFPDDEAAVREKANRYGAVPLPPYVKDERHELEAYQTVYAKIEGSVAAPTAGFHFTPELIEKLKQKGVEFAEVTLHVGLGTFLPVKSERVEDHTMHSEWMELSAENAEKINRAKREGRRVIAVGTTTVRTLEGIAQLSSNGTIEQWGNEKVIGDRVICNTVVKQYKGDINIFITPGFNFRVVDAMITNFHLPKSTLLMLVSAFAGDREFVLDCYEEAIRDGYRFYSFGDAMFIYS